MVYKLHYCLVPTFLVLICYHHFTSRKWFFIKLVAHNNDIIYREKVQVITWCIIVLTSTGNHLKIIFNFFFQITWCDICHILIYKYKYIYVIIKKFIKYASNITVFKKNFQNNFENLAFHL